MCVCVCAHFQIKINDVESQMCTKKMQDATFSAQFLRNLRYCNNLLIYYCCLARALAWRPGVFFIIDFSK